MCALGATFGKYFLSEKIATGGMAELYLAKLIGPGGFEKQLVLKLIHPELSEHRQFVELFVAEAKTLVSLAHGNIVPVYELGVHEGTYFLAMEYIDGPALASLQTAVQGDGQTIDAPIAAYMVAEVLKGLDYAHRKGESVIHRDISPRNVMVSREGEIKLVDFGLAVTELSQQSRRSKSELPAGSFPYMSPEQVRQEPLERSTDLFSLAVVFWEMLTGTQLFHRDTADDTLEAVLGAAIPRPSEHNPTLSPVLDQICMRALSRHRGDRYSDATEFLAELNRYLYSLPSPPGPADVAALVARRCPPTVDRPKSDSTDELDNDEDGGSGTVPMAHRLSKASLDGTTPMPVSRGKGRARTATFATHAALEEAIRGTPMLPISALNAAPANGSSTPPTVPADMDAPSWRRQVLARTTALVLLVAGGALLGWLIAGPSESSTAAVDSSPDAAPSLAGHHRAEGIADAGMGRPIDMDPTKGVDGRLAAQQHDAGTPTTQTPRPRQAPRPAASPTRKPWATVVIGAIPWAEVAIDGRAVGQAPGRWKVTPGKHVIRLTYPASGGSEERRFTISVSSNEEKNLGVIDFRR